MAMGRTNNPHIKKSWYVSAPLWYTWPIRAIKPPTRIENPKEIILFLLLLMSPLKEKKPVNNKTILANKNLCHLEK